MFGRDKPNEDDGKPLEAALDVLHEAYRRWKPMPPMAFVMERADWYLVLTALQMCKTHPGVRGTASARRMEDMGRVIQEQVCDTVEVFNLAESGWHVPGSK